MSAMLDIIGSFIITGSLLLIVIYLTLNMNSASNDIILANINMSNSASSQEVIKTDLARIGFKAPTNKILIAETNRIRYQCDFDNNGANDTIEYRIGQTSEATSTQNPNDFPLYRVHNGTQNLIALITSIQFSYFDSLSSQINYSSLSSQTIRNRIKSITINMNMQSISKVDTLYQLTNWKTNIRPKNL